MKAVIVPTPGRVEAAHPLLDAMLTVICGHAATLAAPVHPLDALDRVQLLAMIRETAAAALPHAVQAALDAGASTAQVARMLGSSR